ncbi:hypothetical protein [Limimaricola litoreus]|uniref:Uncharacterized protein n=1 Tax=Limimaricola litoreus TaxID=2955316 RepID=A0A9X2FQQ5_9RHOB|nr:hypothetical protein [Limimaricola litoreus]MCP1169856.1 hypothetical protein [Limimaricola litoreus]
MSRTNARLHFFRHRDLAEWCHVMVAEPAGQTGEARRAALIEALDMSDITGSRDIEALRRTADLLATAHTRGDASAFALLRGLPTSRRLALAAAAESRIGYLYLQEPSHTDELAKDLSLLLGCLDDRMAS